MSNSKLVCNCNKTMPLDAQALKSALKLDTAPVISSELCRRHLAAFEAAVKNGGDLTVACTQEAPLFGEVHAALKGSGALQFVNIRESAGWSAEAKSATPKIAALLALTDVPEPEPVPIVSYQSGGRLLVIGPGGTALVWAERLAGQFDVSVLVTRSDGELPAERRYPVFSGKPRSVTGYLGAFTVEWEQANPIDLEVCTRCNACIRVCPEHAIDFAYQIDMEKCKAHRKCVKACGDIRAIDFDREAKDRSEQFDLVLDLLAEPMIRLPHPPQGYFSPRRDPLEQALAANQLLQMVGTFEKPRYFVYRQKICAHGRSEIVGCTQCIDVCSTGAISSNLDENRVTVEPHLCMGCGGCASVCPSGAMTYAYPRVSDMGTRVKTVLRTYRDAGGRNPVLLFHNATDGRDLIAKLGRRGRGLPARVIPIEVFHVAALGLDLMLGCIALGASQFVILSTSTEPADYIAALRRQMAYAREIASGLGYEKERFQLIEARETGELEQAVWTLGILGELPAASFNLFDEKRATLDFVFDHLVRHAPERSDVIPLTAGAPYGRLNVDKQACTMCLACVGSCPEGALLDNKEAPQLRFIERNCVQCGICVKTCPEDAITLTPRLLLTKQAVEPVLLNEAEVFNCVKCGKPFGTKQLVESMLGRLGTHSMFADEAQRERLRMCADCRVIDMMQRDNQGSILDG